MSKTVRVKVCGITRASDAFKAAELGAQYLGFIFVHDSPRRIDPATAGKIIRKLPESVVPVGVFMNVPKSRVKQVIAASGIQMAQFHGNEPPEYCESFGLLPAIKAFRVRPGFGLPDVERYRTKLMLLDTFDPKRKGGTGKTFDWDLAVPVAGKYPVILAGGLNPDNIVTAVTTVRPYGVDMNSGVETRPGVKSHEKLEQLFSTLHDAGLLSIPADERSV